MRRRTLLVGLGATSLGTALGCGGLAAAPGPTQKKRGSRPALKEGDEASRSPDPAAAEGRAIGDTSWATGLNDLRGVDDRGNDRRAALYIPTSYDETVAMPFMIAFHGSGGDGRRSIDFCCSC